MTARLRCCVPFCPRTDPRTQFDQWICGDHWQLVEHDRRRVYGRYAGRWRRYFSATFGPQAARIWAGLKRIAIERAAGVSA